MSIIRYTDQPSAFSEEGLREIKSLVENGLFDVEFDGESLVLIAIYQPRDQKGSDTYWHEPIGKVSLKNVIAYSVTVLVEDEEAESARAQLLVRSGLLREIARHLEKKAEDLAIDEWTLGMAARLRIIDDTAAEDGE